MHTNLIIPGILSVSVLLYSISYIKKRPAAILTFGCRLAFGLLYLYGLNILCRRLGLAPYIGLNPCTGLLSGVLGIPGIMLLCLGALVLHA